MSNQRKVIIIIFLLGLIIVSIYTISNRKAKQDTSKTPDKANKNIFSTQTDECLSYMEIVKSKRDLSDIEYSRLMEIAGDDFGAPTIVALTAAAINVKTDNISNREQRYKQLETVCINLLQKSNDEKDQKYINKKVTAISIFRMLKAKNQSELIRPYLKDKNQEIKEAAESFFETIKKQS